MSFSVRMNHRFQHLSFVLTQIKTFSVHSRNFFYIFSMQYIKVYTVFCFVVCLWTVSTQVVDVKKPHELSKRSEHSPDEYGMEEEEIILRLMRKAKEYGNEEVYELLSKIYKSNHSGPE